MEVTLERLDEVKDEGFVVETPEFTLAKPEFVIGRARDCHLQLSDQFVSRHHCELIVDDRDQRVRVRDLGSQNGTYVNETAIEECQLQDGDCLRVGGIPFEVHIFA